MSEHLHHIEQTRLKEMNFYMRSTNERNLLGGSSYVLLGATVLVENTSSGSKLTPIDPTGDLGLQGLSELPKKLAPQPPHSAVSLVIEPQGRFGQPTILSVAEENREEIASRLKGETLISPDKLLERLTLNGNPFSSVLAEVLAESLTRMGRYGQEHIENHLREHQRDHVRIRRDPPAPINPAAMRGLGYRYRV